MTGKENIEGMDDLERIAAEMFGDIITEDEGLPTAEAPDLGDLSSLESDDEDTTPDVDDEASDEDDSEEEPSGDATTFEEFIQFDEGIGLTKQEAIELYRFREFLRENPMAANDISEYLAGRAQITNGARSVEQGMSPSPAQPTSTPTPPADLDLDDPTIKFLYEQNLRHQQDLAATQQRIAAYEAAQARNQIDQYTAMAERAKQSFAKQHDLNPQQINDVEQIAASMQILPALLSGVDPISRLPVKVDPLTALERALEIAYYSTPTYREAEFQRKQALAKKDTSRKRKLNSLSGSSGSTRKGPAPEPQTQQDRHQAMIREVANIMNGQSED